MTALPDNQRNLELVKYRDAFLPTYTYFWINSEQQIVSEYFNTEAQAREWLSTARPADTDTLT